MPWIICPMAERVPLAEGDDIAGWDPTALPELMAAGASGRCYDMRDKHDEAGLVIVEYWKVPRQTFKVPNVVEIGDTDDERLSPAARAALQSIAETHGKGRTIRGDMTVKEAAETLRQDIEPDRVARRHAQKAARLER